MQLDQVTSNTTHQRLLLGRGKALAELRSLGLKIDSSLDHLQPIHHRVGTSEVGGAPYRRGASPLKRLLCSALAG